MVQNKNKQLSRKRIKQLNSHEHLLAIIETAIEGIITVNHAGIIQFFNPAAEKIFAYRADEVIGSNVNVLMPSPFQQEHDTYINNYLSGKPAKIIGIGREVEGKRKNGSIFPMWLSVREFFDGEQQYFTGFIQDISVFKETQEKSRLCEEEFKLLFENAPTGIAVLDLDGFYKNVNSSLCDILGYSKPELLQLSYKDITHPDDIEISELYLNKLLSGELSGFSVEKRYLRKDKKVVNVVLNVALVNENIALAHDYKGNPALLISHVLDITEEVEAEEKVRLQQEQLAHMDRIGMMGEMAAGIAHEINQPLTAIDSYAKAALRRIKDKDLDTKKFKELFEKISKASVRASDVISRLRAMVKRENKKRDHININNLIEETVKLVETDTQASEFKIKLELADTLSYVVADVIQIQQVVLNLIHNAVDATVREAEKYKQVVISTQQLTEENRIQVSVRDYGCGIDDKNAQQLFNPFYTTKESGMGMGLAICQSIIQLHGGRLWFTHNKDKGSTFHFTLPTALEWHEGKTTNRFHH